MRTFHKNSNLNINKFFIDIYLMGVADQRHIDVGVPADLFLWNDDLGGKRIFGVGNGMIHQTDATNDLALLADSVGYVGRVTVDLLAFGDLLAGTHTDNLASLADNNLVDRLVQHVGAAVDCRKSGKSCKKKTEMLFLRCYINHSTSTLGQFSQSVHGVQVRRFAVPRQRVGVKLDSVDGVDGWLV